jgi:very-short-patch-repair endonuclease
MCETLTFQNSSFKIHQVVVDGVPWFRGNDVAKILGYSRPRKAIDDHVDDDDKMKLGEFAPHACADANDRKTMYINESGVRRMVLKSQKPQASQLAKQLGIKEDTRYLRKEIEIVGFIEEVLTQSLIPFEFQKRVANYRIDLYLPNQKLAIEIDENNHADRDARYEETRERRIKRELGCKFLRINPDANDFKLSSCVGRIMSEIIHSACGVL